VLLRRYPGHRARSEDCVRHTDADPLSDKSRADPDSSHPADRITDARSVAYELVHTICSTFTHPERHIGADVDADLDADLNANDDADGDAVDHPVVHAIAHALDHADQLTHGNSRSNGYPTSHGDARPADGHADGPIGDQGGDHASGSVDARH
jgi:hypothetical protein